MVALLSLALAQAVAAVPAPPRRTAVPATDWSCTLEVPDGSRFRLSGRLDQVPVGWDPNGSRPTRIDGEGLPALLGRASFTAGDAGEHFRDYQVGVMHGNETYYVNLKLRRGGAGVAYVTRYVSDGSRQPSFYFAAGLCTSQFDVAPQGAAR